MQLKQTDELHQKVILSLNEIKDEISKMFIKTFSDVNLLKIQKKSDNTIVTNIDIFISDLIKDKFKSLFPHIHFFSEEDQESWSFPILILDPIDGTRELAKGIGECAVSFGIYFSENFNDPRNISWIYNPFTGFEISSLDHPVVCNRYDDKHLLSFVSRTEFNKNFYQNQSKMSFFPKGSIAYKLALLASGIGHFSITKEPKNVWDIAAGTHICLCRGIKLFQNRNEITLIENKVYDSIMIWTPDEFQERVFSLF